MMFSFQPRALTLSRTVCRVLLRQAAGQDQVVGGREGRSAAGTEHDQVGAVRVGEAFEAIQKSYQDRQADRDSAARANSESQKSEIDFSDTASRGVRGSVRCVLPNFLIRD